MLYIAMSLVSEIVSYQKIPIPPLKHDNPIIFSCFLEDVLPQSALSSSLSFLDVIQQI